MQAASPAAACFGKLPTHGDFVRHQAGGRSLRAFDAWLRRGLLHARQRLGDRFDAAFDAAPGVCFVMDPPMGEDVLAGALWPSRDRAGRRYPFLVAVEVPRHQVDGRRLPSWPLRYQAFFAETAALAADAVAGRLADARLPDRLEAIRDLFHHTPFLVDYEFRLRQARVWPLWQRAWGAPEDGRKYVLMKRLTEAFASARGRPVPLPLRFPFSPAAGPLDVSFWLEACWRLHEKPPAEPAFFWRDTTADNASDGALFVALAKPPAALFSHLFIAAAPDDGCIALDDPGGAPTALAALALPAAHSVLLEDETLTLRAFLDQL